MVQWLRLHSSNAECLGLIPGQRAGSHMLQLNIQYPVCHSSDPMEPKNKQTTDICNSRNVTQKSYSEQRKYKQYKDNNSTFEILEQTKLPLVPRDRGVGK